MATTKKAAPASRSKASLNDWRIDQVEEMVQELRADMKKTADEQLRIEKEAREALEKKISGLESKYVLLTRYQWIERIVLAVGSAMGMAVFSGAMKMFGGH